MYSPADWIAEAARRFPERTALVVGERAWTFADLDRDVESLAARLHARGLKAGDRLATVLPNGTLAATLPFAALRIGATLVPLNARLSATEVQWQLRHCYPRIVVRDASDLAESREPEAESREPRAESRQPTANTQLAIIYTSGTTGRPKGAMLTVGNFAASAAASAAVLGVRDDDRWLAVLPLFHVGGLSILLRSAMQGTCAVVHDRFDAAAVNRAIDHEGITIASFVPVMVERLLDARGDRPFPKRFRFALTGGGPMPRSLLERCLRAGIPIATTYGLTEATSQVATLVPGEVARKPGAAGHPLPGIELRIEGGNEGEILVRGPTVMAGYLDDPEATAAAIRDGWLHTGDIGFVDDDGFLFVLDRRDDLIVTGGENVYPAEIEAVLAAHPAIAEAVVIGEPDARWGKRVVAVVRLREDAPPLAAEAMIAFCRDRLAGYKVPREIRVVGEALPRTASGKLQRSRLRGGQ